jgi:predicted alpha/beta-hydrolase family hydrolase
MTTQKGSARRKLAEKVPVSVGSPVSVALDGPADWQRGKSPALVLAPGAGSRLDHPFLAELAASLAEDLLVVRFNFPYQEAGRRSPDPTVKLEAAYRDVLAWLRAHPDFAPGPLVAGGKSMGGRMASHLAAAGEAIDGLAFLGYPLHPPGRKDQLRVAHLPAIRCPMLFIQGTRDAFCDLALLRPVLATLTAPHELVLVPEADHGFKAPQRAGRSPAEIMAFIRETLRDFVMRITGAR